MERQPRDGLPALMMADQKGLKMTQKERYENEIKEIQEKIEELEMKCEEKKEIIKQENISLRELNLNKYDYLINRIEFLGFIDNENVILLLIEFEDGSHLRKTISNFEEKID